jgi:signal transduction histidine kinase
MGFAAIARVTDDRWVTCAAHDLISFGLKPGDELEVETTICHEVHQNNKAVVIDHVAKDANYCNHHTPKIYNIQSYISVPVYKKNGEFFGTLCAIDPNPKEIKTPEITGMFQLYAELISFHLEALEKIKISEENLKEEKKIAELRDRFIAILGHDLKNPIATMRMSADILLKMSKEKSTLNHASMIKSTSYRMQALIDNILDFARGQMGEGIILTKRAHNGSLEEMLHQVIKEVKINAPNREIKFTSSLDHEVLCDENRIGQLFSNLLSNADQHGDYEAPVVVHAQTNGKLFELKVINKGEKIPSEVIENLFKPFYKENESSNKKGLGLGLFIASEIAKAHEGEILVSSNDEETSFTLKMPVNSSNN